MVRYRFLLISSSNDIIYLRRKSQIIKHHPLLSLTNCCLLRNQLFHPIGEKHCFDRSSCKSATTWQNQHNECAPSENSDQPGHLPSLIRVFAVHMKKAWVPSYPLSAKRRLWSGWSETSLGAHSFCWFCCVVAQIIYIEACDMHSKENNQTLIRLLLTQLYTLAFAIRKLKKKTHNIIHTTYNLYFIKICLESLLKDRFYGHQTSGADH